MKRKILIGLLIVYGLFIAYANLRPQNPSVSLEPIDLKTFSFSSITSEEGNALCSLLLKNPDITAASFNDESLLLGITYHYRRLSMEKLSSMVSVGDTYQVNEKKFPTDNRPQCPVHGVLAVWEKTLSMHRFH